mmetsp:Transcript_3313/g.12011  ORF Transcript_3313/g.12011 Transcript_3313/m.12011 type:complete len:362 (-) Transcript_3313:1283-2368(-)
MARLIVVVALLLLAAASSGLAEAKDRSVRSSVSLRMATKQISAKPYQYLVTLVVGDYANGRTLMNESIAVPLNFWDAMGVDDVNGRYFFLSMNESSIITLAYRDADGHAVVPHITHRMKLTGGSFYNPDSSIAYDSDADLLYVGSSSGQQLTSIDYKTGAVTASVCSSSFLPDIQFLGLTYAPGLKELEWCFSKCHQMDVAACNVTATFNPPGAPNASTYSPSIVPSSSPAGKGAILSFFEDWPDRAYYYVRDTTAQPFAIQPLPGVMNVTFNGTLEWGTFPSVDDESVWYASLYQTFGAGGTTEYVVLYTSLVPAAGGAANWPREAYSTFDKPLAPLAGGWSYDSGRSVMWDFYTGEAVP